MAEQSQSRNSEYDLKELSDEASPGEWRLFDTSGVVEISLDRPGQRPGVVGWSGFDSSGLSHGENRSNALFIVELVNAFRAGKLVVRSERGPMDAAGVEKLEPTFLEQIAIEALNEVKAWRDCDGNDGFPHSTREKVEAVLMTYEQRRIHRPLSNERNER